MPAVRPPLDRTTITIRGAKEPQDPITAAIMWSYHRAASLEQWSIVRDAEPGRWAFSARVETIEPFMIRQQPLVFVAPRKRGGFWSWPVIGHVQYREPNILRAILGNPDF